MNKIDLNDVRAKWLNPCGSCDAGLPMGCTCTRDDPRTVIMALVNHLEDLYGNYDILTSSTMGDALDHLELLMETRRKLRNVYLLARDHSFHSSVAHEIMLMIPPKLLTYREELDSTTS